MRPFLAVAVLSATVALAVSAADQDALVASEDAPEAAAGGEPQGRAATDIVYTAWGHDFQLFLGTEGPVNQTTGARTCSAGTCGWAAGLHVPNGARIKSVEFSACDTNATQQLTFALLRSPKVPGAAIQLVPFPGTGVGATPGCTTFTATLAPTEIVKNNNYAYVFVVNSTPGTNVEWNQFRATYSVQ